MEEEQAQIQEALLPHIAAGRVVLEMPNDGRFETLRHFLGTYNPHVVFLSGHGRFHRPADGSAPYATFLFEGGEASRSESVRGDRLASAFVGSGTECVVLSSCESGKAASDELNSGLAWGLSDKGIPHVIGMRESVLDVAGTLFVRALADSLVQRERVDVAVQRGRNAMSTPLKGRFRQEALKPQIEELSLMQWSLPLLITRAPERPLIDWEFPPKKMDAAVTNETLATVSLPARFVGRRRELKGLDEDEEEAFLQSLATAEAEIQSDMALETIINHLSEQERKLLNRLRVFPHPVPVEGIVKLGLDMNQPIREMVDNLVNVSLVERTWTHQWMTHEFQLSQLVVSWIESKGATPPEQRLYKMAADYQDYLWEHERPTFNQILLVHEARLAAGQKDVADRLALDRIVGRMSLGGFYHILITVWLPPICESTDPQIKAEALGQTGKQLFHIGIYDTALTYLKQSLAIRQEIGDVSGLCATLFNMGHIHLQNEEMGEALSAWIAVYKLASKMNLAQALQALEGLAAKLGLEGGLDGWAALAAQMDANKERE